MSADSLFAFANLTVGLAWLFLLGPARWMPRVFGYVRITVPVVLAFEYVMILASAWPWQGGFGSLAAVSLLFENNWILLAGWIHFLAFDFFVGCWILDAASKLGLRHWLVVPALAFTFVLGPAGYLMFQGIRFAHRKQIVQRPS